MAGGGVFFDNIRSRNIGRHEVRGKLDPFEGQAQGHGQAAYQQGLGRTRHAGDQAVAADQQRDQ